MGSRQPRVTVSIPKACELAGVTRRTIYNWLDANRIEYVRTAGGSVRILLDTLFREGNIMPADLQAEASPVVREHLAPQPVEEPPPPAIPATPRRTCIVDGVEYEVMND